MFGVPLLESLRIANTNIAYEDKNTVIGSIPIVVAKCGSYLKDQGILLFGSLYDKYLQLIFSTKTKPFKVFMSKVFSVRAGGMWSII